jgi:hypothetical protein
MRFCYVDGLPEAQRKESQMQDLLLEGLTMGLYSRDATVIAEVTELY